MIAPVSNRRIIIVSILSFSIALLFSILEPPATALKHESSSVDAEGMMKRYGQLPMRFEANLGQAEQAVKFLARGDGYALFLTAEEAVLRLEKPEREASAQLRMRLIGANPAGPVAGLEPLSTKSNYFLGADPKKWRRGVANFARVKYESVYPGVDLVWYGNQRQLEHDFILAPGADPDRIRLAFSGASKLSLDPQGDLILETNGEEVRMRKPVAWQERDGERTVVDCRYRLNRAGQVEFALGRYDRGRTLVIDPILLYSTFVGGAGSETGRGVAVDKDGAAYVVGETTSIDFPVVNPIQSEPAMNFGSDVVVLKIYPAGSALVYATYLGGGNPENGYAVAVGADGAAYLAGSTFSTNFPTTPGAFQTTWQGGADAFVAKISPSGSTLAYSSYLGGMGTDRALGIAVNADGETYLTGQSDSANLPATGFQKTRSGNAVYRSLNRAGDWSPGDSGLPSSLVTALAVDPGNADVVYAGTSIGVFKTTDGGGAWQKVADFNPTQAIAIDPKTPATIFAATTFQLFKSVDGGATWQQKPTGIGNAQLFSVALDPATPATVYVGTDRGVFKSVNGGENFVTSSAGMGQSPFPQPPSIRVTHLVVDPANPRTLYAGTNQGMFKTLNGGELWAPINNGLGAFISSLSLAIDPSAPATLYLGLSPASISSAMYKSVDGGANWVASGNGLLTQIGGVDFYQAVYSIAVDPTTSSTVYAGTQSGGVFKSTDGGADWSQSNAGLNNIIIRSLAVSNQNPATVYAGVQGGADAFVAKMNASGTALGYLSYLGGYENEFGTGIAIGPNGDAFVAGYTDSTNFPTAAALQAAKGGVGADAFIARINATGTGLVYSTYLSGAGADYAQGIALDAAGSAYVAGVTSWPDFPTMNPLQPAIAGVGNDSFVTKLNPTGSALVYSTYLGGVNQDIANGVAVDGAGAAYVAGSTQSPNFPVVDATQAQFGGASDAYVAKINPAGSALVYSTYLGGVQSDIAYAVAVDGAGAAYLTGATSSAGWPTVGPLQQLRGGSDLFIAKLGVDADLAITKTASRNPVMAGANLSYTLTVTNGGLSPATGVVVTDSLPGGVVFISATSTQGGCSHNAGVVSCALGDLPLQATATIALVAVSTTAGTVTNTARVHGNEPDHDPTNNQATVQTTVSNLPSIAGRVTDAGGKGLSSVTAALGGAQTATRQTGGAGFYQFSELAIGSSYTVTPSREGYSFEPASRGFANLNTDQTADFTASVCTYSIAPATQSFEAAGGGGSITVTATTRCPWTAVSSADWIKISSSVGGAGDGVVSFTIDATTAPRSGRISVAGQNFAVYQSVAVCETPIWRESQYVLGATLGGGSEGGPRLLVADFNGDGKRDLVTLNAALLAAFESYRLFTVLAGDGQGGFNTFLTLRLPFSIATLTAGDFNGDGRPDIVDLNHAPNNPTVEIRLNNGQGGLDPPKQYPYTPITRFVAPGMLTGDYNRDGKTDLLIYAYDEFERVSNVRILLNDGSGGLNPPISVSLRDHLTLGLADVNADGNLDLLTSAQIVNGPRELRLYPGDGAGGFGPPISSPLAKLTSQGAFGDFNGDGKIDVACYLADAGLNPFTLAGVLLGDGSGRFGPPSTIGSSDTTRGSSPPLQAFDLNGDGKTDLFAKEFEKRVYYPGDGTGKLGAPVTLSGLNPIDLAAEDLDGDGRIDLALISLLSNGNQAQLFFNRCGASPVIYGKVLDGATPFGVAGVAVRLASPPGFTSLAQTDSGGNYLFKTGLATGANYVVTAERPAFRMRPESKEIINLTSDQNATFIADRFATVVSAASFRGGAMAPDSIAAAFSDGMSVDTLAATFSPLPTQLGNVTGTIKDAGGVERPLQFFLVSPNQVNLLIPPGLALGPAVLTLAQQNFFFRPQLTVADVQMENVSPGLFSATGSGAGLSAALVLRVKADGTQVYESVAQYDATLQQYVPTPIDLGDPAEQVFLVQYGTGVRNRSALTAVTAKIGGVNADVSFAGAVEGLFGLDQINIRLPRSLAGRGDVDVLVAADGRETNAVRINLK